jgi:hypothetical protein
LTLFAPAEKLHFLSHLLQFGEKCGIVGDVVEVLLKK